LYTLNEAVILAGGQGTRLSLVDPNIPKSLMPINGITVLDMQIQLLIKYNIKNLLLITHKFSDQIRTHLNITKYSEINIKIFEEIVPRGTGGAIKEAEHMIQAKHFLLLFGDIVTFINLHELFEFHLMVGSECTIVLQKPSHISDSDLVILNKNKKIIKTFSKPHRYNLGQYNVLSNAGIYVLDRICLEAIEAGTRSDLGGQIVPQLLEKRHVYGFATEEYINDIGVPNRLNDTRNYLLREDIKCDIQNQI
jgi:mannose-1-phosphate guanylyltransferase / phosphomannomutase